MNEHGQEIGAPVPDWRGAKPPAREAMQGSHCRLEPLDADRHAAALFRAYAADAAGRNWTYLPYGPFATLADYQGWLAEKQASSEECFFAIVDPPSGLPVGVAAYLRIAPETGSIEVGHLSYSPALQRTPASTEAMFLMMKRVFEDWGYRRYEWKCDALNAPSRAAARRLGFRFEGVFRKLMVTKGRNRDTAWFAMTDQDWPALSSGLRAWLDPSNFDGEGRQRQPLERFTGSALARAEAQVRAASERPAAP